MRRRMTSPIRPFDMAPPTVVEAAKRIFALVWTGRRGSAGPTPALLHPLEARPYRDMVMDGAGAPDRL